MNLQHSTTVNLNSVDLASLVNYEMRQQCFFGTELEAPPRLPNVSRGLDMTKMESRFIIRKRFVSADLNCVAIEQRGGRRGCCVIAIFLLMLHHVAVKSSGRHLL